MCGKWFSTPNLYWSEPRLGGLRDCPYVGSVPMVLTVAGAAACILLLLREPGAPLGQSRMHRAQVMRLGCYKPQIA